MKIISILVVCIFYFQTNYWPAIKGRWYFFSEDDKTHIDRFTRNGAFGMNASMNFISKDSCEVNTIRYDDVNTLNRFKWTTHKDTLFIYRLKDTLQEKIISIRNDELDLKPIR